MKKYNLSEIMKAAHNIYKTGKYTWAESLKKSWKMAKFRISFPGFVCFIRGINGITFQYLQGIGKKIITDIGKIFLHLRITIQTVPESLVLTT